MIQRKQSIWLLLSALCGAGVFLFDLYKGEMKTGEVLQGKALTVQEHFPFVLIAVVMSLLPLVTIFMFRDRKRQVRMAAMGIVANLSFISLMLFTITRWQSATPPLLGGSYGVGSVLPVISVILLVMAIVGIRGDEKLVRSVDRLR